MILKKTFINIGIFSTIIAPLAAAISCNESNEKEIIRKLKNISIEDLIKSGGLAGDKAREKDYALIKDFVYSLTNEKGKIYVGVIKPLANISKKPEILEYIKKIDKDDLIRIWITIHSKGLNALDEKDIISITNIIGLFIDNKAKIKQYLTSAKEILDSENFKEFLKEKGGVLAFLKLLIPISFPESFKTIIQEFQNGFTLQGTTTYKGAIVSIISTSLKPLTDKSEPASIALGVVDVPNENSFIKILEKEVLVKMRDFIRPNGKLAVIEAEKDKLHYPSEMKIHLDNLINKLKNISSSDILNEDQLPLFQGKGLFNSSQEEFTKNIVFLQSLLQKFLLFFGTGKQDGETWTSNIDSTINKMFQVVKDSDSKSKEAFKEGDLVLKKISGTIKFLIKQEEIWRFALIDPQVYSATLHKMIQKKFNSQNIDNEDLNNIFKLFLKIIGKDSFPTLTMNQAKVLIDISQNGLNQNIDKNKKDVKVAITKLISKVYPTISMVWNAYLKDMIFGK